MSTLDPLGMLRAKDGLWALEADHNGKTVVLGGTPPRYQRFGSRTIGLLRDLSASRYGLTVREAQRIVPTDVLGHLINCGLVDYVPPDGLQLPMDTIAEMWRRNLLAGGQIRFKGWETIQARMTDLNPTAAESSGSLEMPHIRRPLDFDVLEAATRLSFGLPGTSRKCTVVAVAICQALRARGYRAHIQVLGYTGQVMMHSRACVGDEPVDPNDTHNEGTPFRPLTTTHA